MTVTDFDLYVLYAQKDLWRAVPYLQGSDRRSTAMRLKKSVWVEDETRRVEEVVTDNAVSGTSGARGS